MCAHIVTKSDPRSALSRADHGRQKDIYRLALMGNAPSRRLWDEWAAEDPQSARLVVQDVNTDKGMAQDAKRHLDVVLKGVKPKKPKSKKNPYGLPSAKDMMKRQLAATENPAEREALRRELGR